MSAEQVKTDNTIFWLKMFGAGALLLTVVVNCGGDPVFADDLKGSLN